MGTGGLRVFVLHMSWLQCSTGQCEDWHQWIFGQTDGGHHTVGTSVKRTTRIKVLTRC